MLRTVLRFLVTLCLALGASSAFSYPASSGYEYRYCSSTAQTTCTDWYFGATVDAAKASACAASIPVYTAAFGAGETWLTDPAVDGSGNCRRQNSNGSFFSPGPGYSRAATSCPNGGTLSGSTCTCPAGYTDTGTACEQQTCPAAGTSAGLVNITYAWALSPTPDADDVVHTLGGEIYAPMCRNTANGPCQVEVDASDLSQVKFWRAQAPSDQGLYRLSVDVPMKSRGTSPCTLDSTQPVSPTSGSPSCPSGNVGTVNGKSVCLGTMPASGVKFGPNGQRGGNPKAGTAPTDSNEAREPTAANGGGPDARGGPGVTRAPDGGSGTGSGATTGTSGAGAASINVKLDLPTDYNREATQQTVASELQKMNTDGLKIKEDGTPEGANQATTDAVARLARGGSGGGDTGPVFPGDEAIQGIVNPSSQLQSARSSTDAKVSSAFNFAENCVPWEIGQLTIDPCGAPADWLRVALAWVYGLFGVVYLYRRSGDVLTGDA